MIDFQELRLSKGIVEVSFCSLGEGWDGDYDPEDPEDNDLLRFDVSRWDGESMVAVDDASYCTQVPTNTPQHTLVLLLDFILSQVYYGVVSGNSIKRMCERLSWITVEAVDQWGR